jgi:microcystin-dependent protein
LELLTPKSLKTGLGIKTFLVNLSLCALIFILFFYKQLCLLFANLKQYSASFYMKRNSFTLRVLAASLALGSAGIAVACPATPSFGIICAMASARQGPFTSNDGEFQAANGAVMLANQNQALYSLIGNTYGATYPSFALPDLRGKIVIGRGTIADNYQTKVFNTGNNGGALTVTLTMAQMPAHTHVITNSGGLATITSSSGTLGAVTSLSGLTATTSLSGVSGSAAVSGTTINASSSSLSLNAASGSPSNNPAGHALGSSFGIYSTASPGIAMSAGSIAGTISGTLSGTAPATLSGTPTTAVNGGLKSTFKGAPAASIAGSTDIAGTGSPIPIMPPYLVLTYYIATSGIYPYFND